ncbi:MAG: hypothetical protein A4C66_08515 [Nitrospira sp. HN-bin3]|jgi:hypothetical protein|nr:MAG: hypothetical protein A4C66_08515 [Nitrospira sp. HN-bin3]
MVDHVSLSWAFGDQAGWMMAGSFFALLSGGIGWVVYGLFSRLRTMGSRGQSGTVSRRGGTILGVVVGGSVFAMLALTSLSGFARLALQEGNLTIQYRWTGQKVVLPFIEVMDVREEPAFKGQWRLVVVTDTNGTYESALSSHTVVRAAAELLKTKMTQP